VIQAGWITKIGALNQKAFDDAVYKSLNAVVKKVEEKENFVFIKHQVETDTLLKRTKRLIKQQTLRRKKLRSKLLALPAEEINVSIHSDNGKQTKTIVKIGKGKNSYKYEHSSVYVESSALDTVPKPLLVLTPPTPPVPPGPEAIASFDDRKGEVEIIMEKMMNLRDPDSVSLAPKEIEKLILEQLKQNDLPQIFHFALLSTDPKKTFISNIDTTTHSWRLYKVNLYPNDLFGRNITLALLLPVDQIGFKGSGLWGPILLSLLFTLALLVLFIYSIRMLIRHKKMLAMKNDFINHMSHEFKTPLAGISLGADMLMTKTSEMDAAQIQKVASTIKKQSMRLSKEVNDVLQDALMEESINKPHTLFNLVDAVNTQIEYFKPQLEQAHAHIHTNFASDKILLRGDETRWQKVFSNLIDNSLKFSKNSPEIHISIASLGSKIKIEFTDNGIGIASKDLPRIFEKFFRSNYYNQSNIQGFGLGLNFVKSVVDQHKGQIKAESELNAGTRITIEVNAEA
jgi:signal transduction histidine kinase